MRTTILWVVVIGVVAITIFGIIKASNAPTDPTTAVLAVPVSAEDWGLGNQSARAVIVEYSDYQCPACAAFEPILRQLRSE